MKDSEAEKGTIEKMLREALEACRESDRGYEHWLGRNGLDRDVIRRAAGGAGLRRSPELKQAFEAMKTEIEEEAEKEQKPAAGRGEAGAVAGGAIPRWAIMV